MSAREWSKYQLQIFADFEDNAGHTVVEAVAGSGKTTSLAEGLRHAPRHARKGMMAFNRTVVGEMKGKVDSDVDMRTIHSLGMMAVKRAFGNVEVDENKTKRLAAQPLLDRKISFVDKRGETVPLGAGRVAKLAGFAKNCLIEEDDLRILENLAIDLDLDDDPRLPAHVLAKVASETLTRCAEERTTIDYDDMIWFPARHQLRPATYDVLVVDELQDMNSAQLYLAKALIRKSGRIVGAGDIRQSLYRFRGADANAIPRMIVELNARTLPLSISYRCPRAVIALAQEIVPQIEAAPWAEEGEVSWGWTVEQMLEDVAPGDFVLSRTKAPLMGMCLRLLAKGIPACVAGRDIGKSLVELLDRAKTDSVVEAGRFLIDYMGREVERLTELDRPEKAAEVRDRVESVLAICEGRRTVAEVRAQIESLFRDDDPQARVVFSTVHKAKGLERDNIWLFAPSFRVWAGAEEENIYYVAVTRARKHLAFVGDLRR